MSFWSGGLAAVDCDVLEPVQYKQLTMMERLIGGVSKLGIELNATQVRQFELYYEKLIEWNKRFNLTSVTEYEEVQTKHFLDSLTVILALREEEIRRPDFSIIDVGTGAGFPGLPLKILFGEPRIVLLDSVAKKTVFLRHVIEQLELDNVEIVVGRAEEIAHQPLYRQQFALALSRAVASCATLAELALPFCQIGGKFVAQKKGDIGQEIDKATKAIATLGGKLDQVKEIRLEELGDVRYLVIVDKIDSTPEKYPRRSGVPKRRPI
jgi:16S rRNA (guanine527-N7)-methyltransferase